MDSAEILATVTLRAGFNSAVVVAGTACLGVAAGVIGSSNAAQARPTARNLTLSRILMCCPPVRLR